MARSRTLALLAALACGPSRLETEEQVDAHVSRGDYTTACLGLSATREALRAHTAERLVEYVQAPAARDCLCAGLYDAEKGVWSPVVATAVAGTRRDDLATCLQPALSDDRIADKAAVATALGKMLAPAGFAALEALARATTDPAVQAACVAGLEASPTGQQALTGFLSEAPDAGVRAAAAAALKASKDKAVVTALLRAAAGDADGAVRVAATTALADDKKDWRVRDRLCAAMLSDLDAGVRAAAITALKGTTDRQEAECLVARLKQREDDASVREALLTAIKASPHEVSTRALCDQMGPYIRMYVTDKYYDEVGGADIVAAQNDNDWESSYACVERALKQGGYSCQARNYLAHSFNELGGTARPPRCPGMAGAE